MSSRACGASSRGGRNSKGVAISRSNCWLQAQGRLADAQSGGRPGEMQCDR
ncbi:Uncharacterised protein [Bordetella avium]|nr:Uncharacterised protein [Bordetella avium]